jgi:hypothetical protein
MTPIYATRKTMCLECGGVWSQPNGVHMHRKSTGHTSFSRRPVNQHGAVIPPKGWIKP